MIRKSILYLLLGLVLLTVVLVVNTLRFSPPAETAVVPVPAGVLPDSALVHFQQALRFQTVSYADTSLRDTAQFLGFHRYLRRTYPVLHRTLSRETVGRYSLLYRWDGRRPGLQPAVLMAHQDVVPVEAESRASWRYAPFAGTVAQGQVWGRGATDNKANLTAMLEALEGLCARGIRPERTVYLVLGHDEEIGGWAGAHRVADLLHARGITPAFVLDEGGFVTTQRIPGMVNKPVGLIGTAEKGYLSLQLEASVAGGHSSIPEATTALGLVSEALAALQAHSFPATLTPPMQDFADHVGPHMPFVQRLAFANRWLFTPLILKTYLKSAGGAAAVHTTMVPTIFQSGVKDNVVPTTARATVNLRLLPGLSVAAAAAQVRAWLPDARVKVSPVGPVAEPSAGAAATDAQGYRSIEHQLRQQVPGVVPTPFLFVAQSDSRHFAAYTPNIYKFSPMTDPVGLHGLDEHLSLVSFRQCLGFYAGLLETL
jgi:carboxypeptidase PM20D1